MAYRRSKFDSSPQRAFYKVASAIRFYEEVGKALKDIDPSQNDKRPDLFAPFGINAAKKIFLSDLNDELLLETDRLHLHARKGYRAREDHSFDIVIPFMAANTIITSTEHNLAQMAQFDGKEERTVPLSYEELRNLKGVKRLLSMAKKANVGIDIAMKSDASSSPLNLRTVFESSASQGYRYLNKMVVTIYPEASFDNKKYPQKLPAALVIKASGPKK